MASEKDVAVRAIKKAGEVLMEHFRKEKDVRKKDFKELVSNVDIKSEGIIIQEIKGHFPNHSVVSEEVGTQETRSPYTWIIDPLDGTHNYVYGQPMFGISIALMEKDQVILGVIYLPFFDELYLAEHGSGAFLNGRRLEVSKRTIEEAYILYDPQLHKRDDMFENLKKVYTGCFTLRITGCAVYDAASVASGRADARIWHKTKTVDVAAGVLLVREAGGKVSNFRGEPYKVGSTEVIVTNGVIHKDLIHILSGTRF